MKYTNDVKEYVIDQKYAVEQMARILEKERASVKSLINGVWNDVAETTGFSRRGMGAALSLAGHALHTLTKNPFLSEIKQLSKAMDIMSSQAIAMNHVYDFSQLAETLYGCTAAAFWAPKHGMVHCRTLDWPIKALGKATRIFRYVGGKHEYLTVGVLGFSGALSGMVPGHYSLSLNWAPPSGFFLNGLSPTFLLRQVLEQCSTYDEAVHHLLSARTMTGAFFMVCGVEKGQACVVEKTPQEAVVRLPQGPLVHANHFKVPEFRRLNKGSPTSREEAAWLLESSVERCENLLDAVKEVQHEEALEDIASCLDADVVANEDSHQQMIFCAKSGQVKVWRSC